MSFKEFFKKTTLAYQEHFDDSYFYFAKYKKSDPTPLPSTCPVLEVLKNIMILTINYKRTTKAIDYCTLAKT